MLFGNINFIYLVNLLVVFVITCGQGRPIFAQNEKNAQKNKGESKLEFTVQKIKGTIKVRSPFAVAWKPVTIGMNIPEGYLVQIGPDAGIILKHQRLGKNDQPKGSAVNLTITQPMTVRLGPNLLRKTHVTTYFIDTLPKLAKEYAISPVAKLNSSQDIDFKSAWKNVTFWLKGKNEKTLLNLDTQKEKSEIMQQGLTSLTKKIVIIQPNLNAIVQTLTLPMEMTIAWQKVARQDAIYAIYQWSVGTERPQPVAVTNRDSHTLLFPTTGTYFVQITTNDGIWESQPHSVRIVTDNFSKHSNSKGNQSSPRITRDWELSAEFPAPNFTILCSEELANNPTPACLNVSFQVRLHHDFVAQDYKLILADQRGVTKQQIVSKRPVITATIEPGHYVWWVETEVKPQFALTNSLEAQGYIARSESRELSIVTGLDKLKKREWIKDLLSRDSSQSVYLSDGM